MKIVSVAVNIHDHNTYDGVFHNQVERHNRRKHNLNRENPHDTTYSREFFHEHFVPNYNTDRVFAFTVSNLGQEFVLDLLEETLPDTEFLNFNPTNLWDRLHTDSYYYIDHHQSHAAYAFLSSGYQQSDILAIDGRGWQFNCIFINKAGEITNLSDNISIGGLWNRLAQDIGFGYLDAGKVMGLSGFGEYNEEIYSMIQQYLQNPNHRLPDGARDILKRVSKEDVAFTLQYVTMELIKKFVYPLKTSDNLCIAGGVAYNGYMNEEFTKHYTNVHVPPAAGDEGQSLGTYMHADYILNKNVHIPNVYAGKEYNYTGEENVDLTEIAQAIADGKIVGWFQGKSESGNRALGNRSILADPRNPKIKDIINSKIKLREDFRPFAPSVLEEHYTDYFDTNQPSPYMSRIMPVISDAIPGVTHIDGTARIQTVQRNFNPRYYDLINSFYTLTGVPMLLNTSFNCQEPIVETPEDAIATFNKCGLDILVINNYIIRKEK
jgi:carbamoyltransferase|tara:strand:- start:1637 stop:3112 length:1476 start_codon:yes stop_codon:yes gene_type:complete